MNPCPKRHHAPSERTDVDSLNYRVSCECRCHDVADLAPELLAACKKAYEGLGWPVDYKDYQDNFAALTAIIAKAEGGAK